MNEKFSLYENFDDAEKPVRKAEATREDWESFSEVPAKKNWMKFTFGSDDEVQAARECAQTSCGKWQPRAKWGEVNRKLSSWRMSDFYWRFVNA